jgi:hypothetical protein
MLDSAIVFTLSSYPRRVPAPPTEAKAASVAGDRKWSSTPKVQYANYAGLSTSLSAVLILRDGVPIGLTIDASAQGINEIMLVPETKQARRDLKVRRKIARRARTGSRLGLKSNRRGIEVALRFQFFLATV